MEKNNPYVMLWTEFIVASHETLATGEDFIIAGHHHIAVSSIGLQFDSLLYAVFR